MAAILDSLVGSCAKKLQEMITEEAVLILGVKEELKELQRKMTQLQCVLNDAEERSTKESAVNNWLGELRDAMYYADDIIDMARSEGGKLLAERPSSSRELTKCGGISFFTCIPNVLKRHKIAVQIRDFNAELEKISKLSEFLKLQNLQPKEVLTVKRTTNLVELNLVGKQTLHACKRLVGLVLANKEKKAYKVGIVGTGGIGKTTLAQKIYNDQKIKGVFSDQAWICVFQKYSEVAILKEVLRNFGVHQEQGKTVGELSSKLAAAVTDKSFFLVLDDVWQPEVWTNLLRVPLHAAATGVILVTTRHDTIAHAIGMEDVHRVDLMSADVGWEMLWKSMNVNEEKDVEKLQDMGYDIVRKCGGLPLAIKVTASVLATKEKTENEWRKFIDRSAWSVGNLPTELSGALYLSYDDLPSHLKQCFLYLALYPEDWYIERNDLIRLWVKEAAQSKISENYWSSSSYQDWTRICGLQGDNRRSTDAVVAFPKLEMLVMENMPNWEEWSFVEEGHAEAAEGGEDGSPEIQKGEAPSPGMQLLPRLKKLGLHDCPRLGSLPRQQGQEATSLKLLDIRGATCLKVVEDLPFLSELLAIQRCDSLERFSNLPQVGELRINDCPGLRCVEGLASLQQLLLDEGMKELSSQWIPGLRQQHKELHGEDLDVYDW
ncbi:hypothetical protein ACQ4PT_047951 [Festuca glaucescens]